MICLCAGCGASYSVGVNGYAASGQSLQIPEAASISVVVVVDSNAPNPILEKEVGAKIGKLLTERGYRVGQDEADYYLRFSYGIDAGRTVTEAIPIHRPVVYDEYPFSGFYWHGYTAYMPYSEVIHTRWLILKLFDGPAVGATLRGCPGRARVPAPTNAQPLWIGEITSAGTSSDLRELLNYMLVAAFKHFGRDTRRQISTVISRDDERVLRLTEP